MNKLVSFVNDNLPDTEGDFTSEAFVKRLHRIEKLQKQKANLQDKIDDFYALFESRVKATEQNLWSIRVQQVEHLLTFASRKSFSQRQKEALGAWMVDIFQDLESNPFKDSERLVILSKKIYSMLDEEAGEEQVAEEINEVEELENMRQMLAEQFGAVCEELTDEQIQAILIDPPRLFEFLDELVKESEQGERTQGAHSNTEEHYDDDEQYQQEDFFGGSHYEAEPTPPPSFDKLFQGSNLNRMVKKLATILHPDKETDEEKKQEKHEVMTELLDAKKNKDVIKLFELYHRYFPNDEMKLDEDNLLLVKDLLDDKIYQLRADIEDVKSDPSLKNVIYRRFSQRSKKASLKSLDAYCHQLEEERAGIQEFLAEFKTVKSMKPVLSERAQIMREQYLHDPFFLDDFDFFN